MQMTFDECQDIINHRTTGDITQQLSCAQQGWSGNAAWPRPAVSTVVMPPILTPPVELPKEPVTPQPSLAPLINPPMPAFAPFEPNVSVPRCDGVNDWIGKNPLMALGVLGVAWLVLR